MKANRAPRGRDVRTPDGGQMLLLAGFLLAGTAIMAIGTFAMLERTETQVSVQQHQPMLNLFLNTRERANTYFGIVTEDDTADSVAHHLDGYLYSQFQSAHALSLQLNATLAGSDTNAPDTEKDFLHNHDADPADEYATRDGGILWAQDGSECYSNLDYDGNNDGLLTDDNNDVVAAIFWLEVVGTDASLEEYIVIDVPSTSGPGC